ncbi:MAG: alpha/beta hydrolase [Anaerolineales bacterium]|jgi:3-oxoadipate enol-lactonase
MKMKTKLSHLHTGVTIEYSLTGPAQADTLLFVHGLGPNLHQFEPQERYFSQHFQVLLVSLRGHGGSSVPDHPTEKDFTVGQLAGDVKALLAELDIRQAHFIGNSLGGLIGYRLLETEAKLLSSLTTFGTTAELHTSSAMVWFLTSLTRTLGPSILGKLAGVSTKDKAVARQISAMFAAANKNAIWMTQKNISDYDYTPVLQDRNLPMLLVRSQQDAEINAQLDSTLDVLQQNPNFQLRELEGVGHFVNMENPQAFNWVLSDFLTEVTENMRMEEVS